MMMTNPRDETLTDTIATVIQSGHTARKTSHEIAVEVRAVIAGPRVPGRTDTLTLAGAMDVLAEKITSEDGVANAAIAEAAQRLRELAAGGSRAE